MWKVIANIIWDYNKQHPEMALYNIVFITTAVVNDFYLPKYYGEMIDVFKADPKRFLTIFANILIIKAVVYLMYQFEDYYSDIQRLGVKELVQKYIITKIRDKYMQNPEEVLVGEKITTIMKIQGVIANWYVLAIEYLVPYSITLFVTASFMYSLDAKFPLLLIFLIIGSFIMIVTNIYFCSKAGHETNTRYLKVYQEVEDHLSNLLTIQTYNETDNEQKKLDKYQKSYQSSFSNTEKCTLTWRLVGIIFIIAFLYMFMYKAYTLLTGKIITHKSFMSLYFIVAGLLSKLIWMTDIFHNISLDYSTMYDLQEINDLDLFGDSKKPSLTYSPTNPIKTDNLITLKNIHFKYAKAQEEIIYNFSLDVKKGDRIALVGDIGSGKSTLLKIILGLLKPQKGELYLKRYGYGNWEQTEIFQHFGYMTQNPILFNRSILDNVLFSNPKHTRKEVEELLEFFNLNEVFSRLEKGIDTSVGKNGSNLSGGQRQIVWFLRIYLNNPEILLLDEPTASLSRTSKEKLWSLIQKGFQKKTIIMASHDDFLIKMANRKVKL